MLEFKYQALPWNIEFGAGALGRLPALLDQLGLENALVLTTPEQASMGYRVADLLGDTAVGLFAKARMHVPQSTVDEATEMARNLGAKCTVAVGGGSTTGLGKALALHENLENVVIPTTYAGSEMTNIWGITNDGRKVTGRDMKVVPTLTIYDPELTLTLPVGMSAASGLNAMAQAVANVATDKQNPLVACLALDGIRALAEALPAVVDEPDNIDARARALYGASLAGGALGTGITSLHHKLCHVIGGTFDTPHAETHAILLPHSVAYSASGAEHGTRQVAEALGVSDAAMGLYELGRRLGIPAGLCELGVSESDLDLAAEMTTEGPVNNPVAVNRERVRALLQRAHDGAPPQA